MLYFRRGDPDPHNPKSIAVITLISDGLNILTENTLLNPSFSMNTYELFSRPQKFEDGNKILQHLNDFLATFTPEEQVLIYQYYVSAKQSIARIESFPKLVRQIIDELSALTYGIMTSLHMPEKALEFIGRTVTFPDLSYVGAAIHFSEKYSFYLKEYQDLTAMSWLCKFLSPCWGHIINLLVQPYIDPVTHEKSTILDEQNNKELFCATMIVPVLETGVLAFTYDKLYNYMCNLIDRCIKQIGDASNKSQPSIDFVMAKYGYDKRRFEDYIYAMVLVKRLVGFDPDQTPSDKLSNIGTYTNMAITSATSAQLKRMRNDTRIMTRNDLTESSNESDSVSFLDNMSRISLVTADVPLEVVFGVRMHIPRLCAQEQIDPTVYNDAVSYYLYRLTDPSVYNYAIMSSLHAHWVGGSSLLRYLDFETYTKLLTYTQMLLIKQGFAQLAVYLTCRTSPGIIGPFRSEGQRIRNNITNTSEYKRILDAYPGSMTKKVVPPGHRSNTRGKKDLTESVSIATQLERLQNWIINYTHIADIAPGIKEMLPIPWKDNTVAGEPLNYTEHIMQELCEFFLYNHNKAHDVSGLVLG